ncbi:MAG TPA: ABC transporter ATP-binding protein [Thermoanaerobaculia bacterium]|nr:ABC transporter ATP-binding protein [Thermoanaerobaculia bacterium]
MRRTADLDALAWPASRLGEALSALARRSGLDPAKLDLPEPEDAASPDDLDRWIAAAASAMELEAEPVEASYGEVEALVQRSAPALLRLPGDRPRFLLLLDAKRSTAHILASDHQVRRAPLASLRDALRGEHDARLGPEVDRLLAEAEVPARRRARARAAILAERLTAARIGGFWLLDLPPGGSSWMAARRAHLPVRATVLVGAHMVQHTLLLLSWWVLGLGVLQGRLDRGWLFAWALLQLTFIPFRSLELWSAGVLMSRAGRLFKRRLMMGALKIEPEEIRHQGAGQLLSRILNAEAIEFLALTGAHVGAITLSEIVLVLPVLVLGAAGWPHALLLLAWVAVALWLCWRYFQQRRAWTATRLEMTHDLVEQMVGHRTRLAQQSADRWHEQEDRDLERYLDLSAALDRRATQLRVLIPRGWLLISLLALAVPFVSGEASAGSLAVSLGGALFAYWSFWKMVRGLADLAEAAIAWRQVAPIFHAAGRVEKVAPEAALLAAEQMPGESVVVEAHELVFRYGERSDPALAGCTLTVRAGERLLLEGPSGGGKSTLGSLLAGLRVPQSGLLLLAGLDRHSLGLDGWRRRAVAAPQFQENHVLTDTFAFNLLMGREWPPRPGDFEAAEAVCRELGLGELLDRMPAGLLQMVGESGWQLSHGEKSRLYIARALLQRAELVVLDESFAALDPESLRRALRCVLARARTLLVIAHP